MLFGKLTRIGFHTLSKGFILGISTTIRFGSILPNAFLGALEKNVELNPLRDCGACDCQVLDLPVALSRTRKVDCEKFDANRYCDMVLLTFRALGWGLPVSLAADRILEANREG